MFRRTSAVLAPIMTLAACVPYTVGTTAQPVPVGERSTTMSTFVMPSFGRLDSTHSFSNIAIDFEQRWGVDQRSDVGIRVPSGTGLILNYKRLISDPNARTKVAIMPGAGFVNLGQHAHFELTLLASGYDPPRAGTARDTTVRPLFVPFGGLRVMQVAPLAEGAVSDRPTAGGFLGVRIGSVDFGISPEIGVFYDHSALGVRRGDLVIVPAISVHGERLVDMIQQMMGRGRHGIFALRSPPRRSPAAAQRPPAPIVPIHPGSTTQRPSEVYRSNGKTTSDSTRGNAPRRVPPRRPRASRGFQLLSGAKPW